MTSTRTSVPVDVAGLEPDVDGATNEPVARAPVNANLPTKALSDAWALLAPGAIAAAFAVAPVVRGWVW
jgi:hypothetical protein